MKKFPIAAILLIALAAFCAGAVRPQAANPSVNDILTRYVNALGGRAALMKVTTRISKGSFEVSGISGSGTAESFSKAPNKYLSIVTIPGIGEVRRCFDGKIGWVRDPHNGVVALMGQDLADARRTAEIDQAVKLTQLYPKMLLKGQEPVDGWPAYVIVAEPGDGSVRRMYFDTSSGLLVRNDDEITADGAKQVTESYLSDYRDVEGVKIPFTIRQVHGETTAVVRLTDVQVNKPVDDSVFLQPVEKK